MPQNLPPDAALHEFVTVSIYDQTYHLSGNDLEQVEALAARVDARMRTVASHSKSPDSLRVAVLAALNLADELAQAELRLKELTGEDASLRQRASNLRGLLDSVLESNG